MINIYAHTHSTDKQHLWRTLSEANIEVDFYLFGRDFNMVE